MKQVREKFTKKCTRLLIQFNSSEFLFNVQGNGIIPRLRYKTKWKINEQKTFNLRGLTLKASKYTITENIMPMHNYNKNYIKSEFMWTSFY